MFELTVKPVFSVYGGFVKGIIPVDNVKIVENKPFCELAKSSSLTVRLLGFPAHRSSRALTNASIFSTIMKLRNASAANNESEDLCLDELVARPQRHARVVSILAPAVGDAPAQEMNILFQNRKLALWVELTAENLKYFRLACQHEIGAQNANEEPGDQAVQDEQ